MERVTSKRSAAKRAVTMAAKRVRQGVELNMETTADMFSMADDKPSLDLLLLGKTGHGKSASGNSILGHRFFRASSHTSSVTFKVSSEFSELERYIVKVVDGPGTGETRLKGEEAVTKATNDMAEAMTHVTQGFHAMIIVFKFGHRFTKEEQDTIYFLKGMLGPEVFIKYGVCILTCGDLFQHAMEEDDTPEMTPLEWCSKQDNNFAEFVNECGGRVVLFDNISRDATIKQQQVEELIRLIENLPNEGVRYTNAQFIEMNDERQKLIMKSKLPQLEEEIQQKCSLLKQTMGKVKFDHPDAPKQVAELKKKADALVAEIFEKDKGTMVLMPLKKIVDSLYFLLEKFEVARQEKNQEKMKGEMAKIQAEFKQKEGAFDKKIQAMKDATTKDMMEMQDKAAKRMEDLVKSINAANSPRVVKHEHHFFLFK